MRGSWLGAVLALVVVGSGCSGGGDKKVDPEETKRAAKEQQDLLARRDGLLKNRDQLSEEKAKLELQIEEARKTGGETATLEVKLGELSSKQDKNKDEIIALLEQQNQDYKRQLDTSGGGGAGGDKSGELAKVVATLERRDSQLADVEKRLVSMASALTDIKSDIAKNAEQCSQMAGTPTIIQTTGPSGSKYGKRDIEPLLAKARGAMGKKGLLSADLPGPAQALEREATSAMGEGEYGKAFYAATALLSNIDAVKVDRGFIAGKISRMSKQMKGRKLDEATQKQVEDLFREATEKYGDGDFSTANKRLNQIASLI